jgi:hypothetical protein
MVSNTGRKRNPTSKLKGLLIFKVSKMCSGMDNILIPKMASRKPSIKDPVSPINIFAG